MARKSNPVYYDANGNVVQPPAKKKGGCLKYALIGLLAGENRGKRMVRI